MDGDNVINRRIAHTETIKSALKQMDYYNIKLLLVFMGDKFICILTIGDIQRAIINNTDLSNEVSKIIDTNKIYASIHDTEEDIKALMLSLRIECMPVLDDSNELVNVFMWSDFFHTARPNRIDQDLALPVVIMAGGKGSRLAPLTNVLPKPLIPINEKTIIEDIMDRFLSVGCNNFYVSVNYKAEMIKSYLNEVNGNYCLNYFQENRPLGTAGSLSLLKGRISTSFFVSNCDILINEDYSEIFKYHKENENEITLVAAIKSINIPYGTIVSGEDGLLVSMQEKPEVLFMVNAGLYLLEPRLLDEIPENTFFHITELVNKLKLENRKVGVFPISEKSWIDIGTWDEYKKFIKQL